MEQSIKAMDKIDKKRKVKSMKRGYNHRKRKN